MLLNNNWKLQYFEIGQVRDLDIASPEYIDHFWMTAKVPGDVHSTLIEKKIIEDPFFGHNDLKSKWIEEKVWWYRTEFEYKKIEVYQNERIELIFEGLDTFATVYLNGLEIGETNNMFIEHTFDVTREVITGKNILAVKFDPVFHRVKEKEKNYWAGFGKDRIWTRKAQSHFGWDWGPQILTVGIWKNVRLEQYRYAKIDNLFAKTLEITDSSATIQVDIELDSLLKNQEYQLVVKIIGNNQEYINVATTSIASSLLLEINNPKLWWTHDLGEPYLYKLEASLFKDDELLSQEIQQIGIRTIDVKLEDDDGNKRFTFVLNGVVIFAKGANWIPIDCFIGPTPDLRYSQLITLAKEGNMNMLRVWGGGIYERDIFYQECNCQGILVWQDFMFACALYPDYNKDYIENVKAEIVSVVKRLRNHPSIALWCGNNENDWLFEVEYSAGRIKTPFYGEKIYHQLIPNILKELDTTRLYWPSSPFGGNDYNSEAEGDRHNWQVWHGNIEPRMFGENLGQDYSVKGVSLKNYKKDYTRFSSEFGMHASANRYTLERNIPKGSFYLNSDEMSYRNKDYHHKKGILLMEGYTGIPKNIDEYINFSMLTQAEGLKFAVEHYRRHKPETSGALIWQLNDCWPGTSWSMIDYYLLPKASYFYAKKFNQPILYTLDIENDKELNLWIVNDSLQNVDETITMEAYHFNGKLIYFKDFQVEANANSKKHIATLTEKKILADNSAEEVVIRLISKVRNCENYYYLRDYKDLKMPMVNLLVEINQEQSEVIVTADDHFARFVKLELPYEQISFSDNYFDLLPNERKKIQIKHLENKVISLKKIKVTALNGYN